MTNLTLLLAIQTKSAVLHLEKKDPLNVTGIVYMLVRKICEHTIAVAKKYGTLYLTLLPGIKDSNPVHLSLKWC